MTFPTSTNEHIHYLVKAQGGVTTSLNISKNAPYDVFLYSLLKRCYEPTNNCLSSCEKINDLLVKKATKVAFVAHNGKVIDRESYKNFLSKNDPIVYLSLHLRLLGGMTDRQNRVGSKFGGGGVSSSQNAERERKERLRQLALESVDLAKDPYLMRNHLGTYECKLCLTLHTNEGNYLAHTQGKKHQAGLARRAAMEAKLTPNQNVLPTPNVQEKARQQHVVRIGRPGYEVSKSRDPETNQRCLSFELHYPELDDGSHVQPRHRFMSAYEQRVESPPDRRYQYLLIACEPYETVAFKIPNEPVDKSEGRFITNWDEKAKRFTLTLYFIEEQQDS